MKNLALFVLTLIGFTGLVTLNSCEKEIFKPSLETETLLTEQADSEILMNLDEALEIELDFTKRAKSLLSDDCREMIYSKTFTVDRGRWVNLRMKKNNMSPAHHYRAVVTPSYGNPDLYLFGYDYDRPNRWRLLRKSATEAIDESYMAQADLEPNENKAYFSVYGKTQATFKIEIFKEKINAPDNHHSLLFYDNNLGLGVMYGFNGDGTLGDIKTQYNEWDKTWEKIIPYSVGKRQYTLFYDGARGIGLMYKLNDHGALAGSIANYNNWDKGWDVIAPYTVGDKTYFLFYDSQRGLGLMYNLKDDGTLGSSIANYDSWDRGWDVVTPYSVGNKNYLLFYDDERSLGLMYSLNNNGSLGASVANYSWSKGWDVILPYKVEGKTCLLFYDSERGLGLMYKLNDNGTQGANIATYNNWDKGWDVVTPYAVDCKTYLLFYDSERGLGSMYSLNDNGALGSGVANYDYWHKGWDIIRPF